ncbi:hypothetical protein E2562_025172 [Oryza meyeriana var. granulata]|uniref:Uncharacterized protein n=1 Tax=Oryza meyeriana var. granulata TaxID=110450 RepID=A0A6G1E1C2_9ORYZ|nr:hypothetical protein E2562_025172 [Oryza meyeriana var. granulata]
MVLCKLNVDGADSTLLPMDQGVDNNVIENSLVSSCDFPVVRKVEKFVGEEACVQALLENMEDAKSLGLVADEDPSYGRKTPHGSFFDPFATRPEELACAPKKKVISATEVASQRRLSFELVWSMWTCENQMGTKRPTRVGVARPHLLRANGGAASPLPSPARPGDGNQAERSRPPQELGGTQSQQVSGIVLVRIMEFNSKFLTDQGVDNNVVEVSLVVNSDLPLVEEVEKCAGEEVSVQVLRESNEDAKSLSTVCDYGNSKSGVAEAITPPEKEAIESSISIQDANEDPSSCCQTPRESIFDPFAPGPEEVACAPKKVIRATEVPLRRQLSFESGIADTCPDAPLRQSLKVVKLSPSICRRLNFDSPCA